MEMILRQNTQTFFFSKQQLSMSECIQFKNYLKDFDITRWHTEFYFEDV